MKEYSLARSFAMTRALIDVKGVWDSNDDALGALHLSILHWIQQGEHKVILIQKDCAFNFFHLYELATYDISKRQGDTHKNILPDAFSEVGHIEGHAGSVQRGDQTAQGGHRL